MFKKITDFFFEEDDGTIEKVDFKKDAELFAKYTIILSYMPLNGLMTKIVPVATAISLSITSYAALKMLSENKKMKLSKEEHFIPKLKTR